MSQSRTAADSWARSQWILGGIIAAIVIAFIAIGGSYLKGIFDKSAEDSARDRFIHCVQHWSNAYTRRADLLQNLSTERTDALDARIRAEDAFLHRLRADPGNFNDALARLLQASSIYGKASRAYRAAQHRHPIPASPQFVCSHGKEGVAPGRVAGAATGPSTSATSSGPTPSSAAPQPSAPATTPTRPTTAVRTVSGPRPRASTSIITRPARPPVTRTVTRPPHPPSTTRPGGLLPSLICGLDDLPVIC